MRSRAKQLLKHPLIQGSAIVVFGTLFANLFNFLFNLFMSRSLSVEDYGVLASITSLVGLPGLFVVSLTPMVISFAGEYFAKNRLDLARGLYIKIMKLFLIFAAVIFTVFIVFLPQISEFFHINDTNLLILAIMIIILSIISTANNIFIQAKLAFKFQVSSYILGAILKLIIGVMLIYLGYSVGGAVFAIFAAGFIVYFYTLIPLKFIFNRSAGKPKIDTRELIGYGLPSALALFGLTSLISMDIILVKHYFSPEQAGIYAGLALVGKVIFYVSSPVAGVMFPVIVQKYNRNEKTSSTFILSVFLVLGSSVALTCFYYLFPEFTILFFLKKTEYLSASGLLGLFGVYITLFSLSSVLTNFYLSIKKTIVYIPLIIAAISQIVLIIFYHSDFYQIIIISLLITFLLNIILLLYYPYASRK